jgi:hypothetical protein
LGCSSSQRSLLKDESSDGGGGATEYGALVDSTEADGGNKSGAASAQPLGTAGTLTATNSTTIALEGVAGAANANVIETTRGLDAGLTALITEFCALPDVTVCSPNCVVDRKEEAAYFVGCQTLYRALMDCQMTLVAALRTCVDATPVTPTRCLAEDEAYWQCVIVPPAAP